MDVQLGEEGTEQFTVEVMVDGKIVKSQAIHDPFIHNTTTVWISRWDHFKAIFKKRVIVVQVGVSGSLGAIKTVMNLDPKRLQEVTAEMMKNAELSRKEFGGGIGVAAAEAYRKGTLRS